MQQKKKKKERKRIRNHKQPLPINQFTSHYHIFLVFVTAAPHFSASISVSRLFREIQLTEDRYRDIAKAMGVSGTENMTIEEARKAAVDSVRQLAIDVGIPQKLNEIGAKVEDITALAELAMVDACTPGNPKDPSLEDIKAIYEKEK